VSLERRPAAMGDPEDSGTTLFCAGGLPKQEHLKIIVAA